MKNILRVIAEEIVQDVISYHTQNNYINLAPINAYSIPEINKYVYFNRNLFNYSTEDEKELTIEEEKQLTNFLKLESHKLSSEIYHKILEFRSDPLDVSN